jgi:O-antigen/teichoic acid export membrane protein
MAAQQQKSLTLRRNFSWTFVSNVVYAGCQWGMLVVLAKLGSPEMVGQFTLGLAVTAPVLMFTKLHLRAVQATDARNQFIFGDYLGLRLISTGLALLIIIGITLKADYRWETLLVILVVGLAKSLDSIGDVFYGLLQQHERMERIAVSTMINGLLSLLLLALGVYLTRSVLWGAVGSAVASGIVLFSYDFHSGALILNALPRTQQGEIDKPDLEVAKLQPRWHLKTLRKLVWLSLPLGIVMMLISLNANMPRYFIEQYLGERELGVFAAIFYLMLAGRTVISALGESASPRLAKYYAAGNSPAFRVLLLKLVGIGALLGGVCVLFAVVAGREILTVIYGVEYAEQADLFVWLMVVAGITYVASFLGYGMTAARYFRIQMPIFVLVTAISGTACFWLIPSSGLRGAALALLIAAMVEAATTLIVVLYALHRLRNTGEGI